MQKNIYSSLSCQIPGHEQQPVSYFCVDEDCSAERFLCVLCAHFAHEPSIEHPELPHISHEYKPLKYFISKIKQDIEAIDYSLVPLAKIDQLKFTLQSLLSKKQIQKQNQIANMLKIAIEQYFNQIDSECSVEYLTKMKKIWSGQCSREVFHELVGNYYQLWRKYYDEEKKDEAIYVIRLNALIEDLIDKIKNIEEQIKKGEIDLSLLDMFKSEASSKKFYFTPRLMNSGLTFVNKTKMKISGYADYNYFALCEPALSAHKVQKISFKMVNISSYVTLGICIKNKVQGNYQFMSDGIGHGSYQISYDGYLWSDHDSSVNSQYSGWYFNGGDTVTVQVTPKTKSIKFIKNNDQSNTKTINYQSNKNDKLHFCISMNSEPQEIDIIQ